MDDITKDLQDCQDIVTDIDEGVTKLKATNAELLEACITAYEHIGGVYHRHNLAMARLSKVIRKHKGE